MSGQAFRRAPKPPQFTIVPGSNTVNSGENVTFEAKASSTIFILIIYTIYNSLFYCNYYWS